MEKRLGRLETIWQADRQAVSQASYDIEWTLRWGHDVDPEEGAAAIAATHGLDAAGIERAIELVYRRWGVAPAEPRMVAALGLVELLTIAVTITKEAA